jgi:hypothetical protein
MRKVLSRVPCEGCRCEIFASVPVCLPFRQGRLPHANFDCSEYRDENGFLIPEKGLFCLPNTNGPYAGLLVLYSFLVAVWFAFVGVWLEFGGDPKAEYGHSILVKRNAKRKRILV